MILKYCVAEIAPILQVIFTQSICQQLAYLANFNLFKSTEHVIYQSVMKHLLKNPKESSLMDTFITATVLRPCYKDLIGLHYYTAVKGCVLPNCENLLMDFWLLRYLVIVSRLLSNSTNYRTSHIG